MLKYIVYIVRTNLWKEQYMQTYELYLVTNKINGKSDYLISNNLVTTRYATDGIRSACKVPNKVMYGFQWKFVKDIQCND